MIIYKYIFLFLSVIYIYICSIWCLSYWCFSCEWEVFFLLGCSPSLLCQWCLGIFCWLVPSYLNPAPNRINLHYSYQKLWLCSPCNHFGLQLDLYLHLLCSINEMFQILVKMVHVISHIVSFLYVKTHLRKRRSLSSGQYSTASTCTHYIAQQYFLWAKQIWLFDLLKYSLRTMHLE